MLQRTQLFGLDLINDNDFEDTVNSMLHFAQEYNTGSGKLPLLFTPNVDDVVKLHEPKYSQLAEILRKSYYILPDGQPVIWASKWLGKPLKSRLPGSELFPILWKRLVAENKRIMVVAPSNQVGELLKKELPSLVYYVPPFFDENDREAVAQVANEARNMMLESKPDYVFLGIRFPKQNYIALGMMGIDLNKPDQDLNIPDSSGNTPLFLLLGASYEFYLQLKKRAPAFWQKVGLEWFYRFTQEPARLFRRYFIDDIQFFPIVWREKRKRFH
jgi:N-acetylglucosaminyldiphosphoundecaprenol N-acetyl-beta-D-mannosaminyltransferase